MSWPCWTCEADGLAACERHHPTVCVCAYPQPDAIGECQRCYRPAGERFAAARRLWLMAIDADDRARAQRGAATAQQLVGDDVYRHGTTSPLGARRAVSGTQAEAAAKPAALRPLSTPPAPRGASCN